MLEELREVLIGYYGSDHWLYICHPKLGYISPIRYLKDGGHIDVVLSIAASDILG